MKALPALIALAACGAGCSARPGDTHDGTDGRRTGPSPDRVVSCLTCTGPADAGTADAPPLDAPPDAPPDGPPDGPPPDGPPGIVSCSGQTDPVIAVTSSPYSGSTAGANGDTVPSCGGVYSTVPDVELQLELPAMLTFHAHLVASGISDAAVNLGRCGGGFLGWGSCDGNAGPGYAAWGMNHVPAGRYYLVAFVSPADPPEPFTVTVSGVIQPNGRCDVPLASSGAFVCAPGTSCNGTSCVSASGECGDGVDNDGDGLNGYPDDPGCETITDPSELDDCPMGPLCPPCATPSDQDGDGYGGYPDDPGCESPGDYDEHDDCGLFPWNCPICGDLYDNDDDGLIDRDDPSCASAAWNDEYPEY